MKKLNISIIKLPTESAIPLTDIADANAFEFSGLGGIDEWAMRNAYAMIKTTYVRLNIAYLENRLRQRSPQFRAGRCQC